MKSAITVITLVALINKTKGLTCKEKFQLTKEEAQSLDYFPENTTFPEKYLLYHLERVYNYPKAKCLLKCVFERNGLMRNGQVTTKIKIMRGSNDCDTAFKLYEHIVLNILKAKLTKRMNDVTVDPERKIKAEQACKSIPKKVFNKYKASCEILCKLESFGLTNNLVLPDEWLYVDTKKARHSCEAVAILGKVFQRILIDLEK